ncbi:hypothetical protein [Agrobacterium tumefaciens]|uniref:hypothetical protein n=1 Tax=Agrobacterium tumefaciens TaxID=358 RepID=UPI00138690C9|nr:hypothetical protein [Agrobacterium tumefaciens]
MSDAQFGDIPRLVDGFAVITRRRLDVFMIRVVPQTLDICARVRSFGNTTGTAVAVASSEPV